MVKTTVVNDTESEIDVKEGNVGVYIPLQTLSKRGCKNSSCVIHVDTNATYREYWIAALADDTGKRPIVVTSDDCIDNSVLTIKFDGQQYICARTARNAPPRRSNSLANHHNNDVDSNNTNNDDDNNGKTVAKAGWKERFFAVVSKWGFSKRST